ncbi:hypothetical protein B484DRAFT_101492 [Ochromonadaceae sp. CCMP2298]|nr:hypothetical protein B484DRAFT_101492 [Ochromonadaceae sp. CCMP2298]
MDAMDGARDLLDKTEGPTSINPLVSPLIEATPLPAHPDYGLSGSTDNEYSESTTRSKSSELNQREAHRQMPVMPGMPGMPGLQMEQGDLSRGTSEDDFSSFFSSAIQLSSNSFTSDTSMSNSSSTRSPIIGGVAMGGGGGGGGGYHNAAAAKQAASALCAPSHDSYFPEGSGRGSGSGNLYGGADRDKYEHGHHDQNAQGQYNQADRFPNVSSPMLSTNTPSLPSPLSQHQHRTLPSASAPGTPSRALQMQEMQRIHQMQQAQMQMRHPLRGPSNSAPCTPVNAFRAMQHERQKWGDAPLLNTNTDGFGGGGGYGGGRQFQYEQGHSQQGQQGQQGQGRNAYNDSMQSQQHYQQQQQQQRLMQQKWQMQQQQYEPHGGGGGYMGRGAFGPAGSGSGSEWQQQYNRGVGTQQQQPYSSPPPLPETGAELGLSLGLVGPSMLYRVRFKHETQSFALSPSCTAQVGIGSFVLVEGDRGEDIGVVEEVLPLQVLVDQRIARGMS